MAFNFSISWGNKNKQAKQDNPNDYEEAIKNALKEYDKHLGESNQKTNESEMPIVKSGRSSIYEGIKSGLGTSNSIEPTSFPFEQLKFLQQLAMWNRHISLAVENIVTLGNTPYTIDFGNTPKEKIKEMRAHLNKVVPNWYEHSEGEASLDNDLLSQAAIYGAISAESVIKKDLSGISKIVRVDPYNIRFAYDAKKDTHTPLQKVDYIANNGKTSKRYNGYIELNTNQYSYIAMRRFGYQPYAVPPFISAIEDILIENDMVKNFANIMRRLGMLGLLSVLVKAPPIVGSETPTQYQTRMVQYLKDLQPGVEDGLHKGVVVGFKDSHEIKLDGSNINAGAGENLMKMVQSLIFSGLKQDPTMHGENNSTTETFARVMISKMSRQVANYQGALASFKERNFLLELRLNGFNPEKVKITYSSPTITDRKAEADTNKVTISNARDLYNDGLISQEKRAEMLSNITGEEEPDQEEPRATVEEKAAEIKSEEKKETSSNSIDSVSYNKLLVKMGAGKKEYDYSVPDNCSINSFIDSTDFKEPKMTSLVGKYLKEVNNQFVNALDKASTDMTTSLESIVSFESKPSTASVEAAIMTPLLQQWGTLFSTPVNEMVEESITEMYTYFRKDETPFRDAANFSKQGIEKMSMFEIPESVFTMLDARALEYLQSLDQIWLGKFITDEDTLKRITRWIEKEMVGKNLTLGRDGEAVKSFVDRFIDEVKLESWKIRRIIETTANKVRNTANLMYINQAKVEKYEVVEVLDKRTCGWCRHMHGKIFSVSTTLRKLENATNRPQSEIASVTPFATTVNLEDFTNLSAIELQTMGHDVPSFHAHCRGRVVGVI